MKNIIDLTLDAITASGKRFSELPKEAMFMFLQRNGVSKEDTNNIYDKIGNICNNTRDKIYSGTSVFKAPKAPYVSDKYIAPDEQDTYSRRCKC
jgi:triphosphoribosyl-dephospho-CoA synthetase